ncbi:M28 family peptidase [Sinomicrobium soli]|uniref:M28 family peptidase n=1 Tax=Sinomicrobium sp. N-1-3-6 TaxID=2219864 RepID=UPI000DCEF12F|nr:M28 family peptidase [Sinomicrobium sp. N-1-3-6]RAV30423.1 peptidase M28 [Sinomicrobium sp. N-1-3-6]
MKRYAAPLSLLLLCAAVYWSFYSIMPQAYTKVNAPENSFSTERALLHVRAISKKPHYVGAEAHEEVRDYLVSELEKLGLAPEIQEGYTSGNWGNISKADNIIATIKGSGNGNALMLLSHYDSAPHSSFGASDAGSGVAAILEGIRAYLSEGLAPENDIIIMFSDAEELGLNGAKLFVSRHPVAKEVKLVLNFEARGSGGPSFMLPETNRGNSGLIKAFAQARPRYPVASSLMYSVYKILPNDTDLTVFREDGDIDGFNFAFIDDHYDYHTALDTGPRLDRTTLEHQGAYLMPLLRFFADSDIANLKDDRDHVFFNAPGAVVIHYPFSWIWPVNILALILFIGALVYGFRKKVLRAGEIFRGAIPFLSALLLCGLTGYFSWPVLLSLYPGYADILQGFPYNGHTYIAAFALLSTAICLILYHGFRKLKAANLLVVPILVWLLLCTALGHYLKGASFFIIPVYFALFSLFALIRREKPRILLMTLLALPAIWLFSPLIRMFPVGLGLKMIVASTLLTVLLFVLLLPVIASYRQNHKLALLTAVIAAVLLTVAHTTSDFDKEHPRPDSLVYLLDTDTGKAHWATYDQVPGKWISSYFPQKDSLKADTTWVTFGSKYLNTFTHTAEAPAKNILPPEVEILHDTVAGNERLIEVCITPERHVNRLDVFSAAIILSCTVNGAALPAAYLEDKRRGERLFSHFITGDTYTEIQLRLPPGEKPQLTLYESSFDLLEHPLFSVAPRPEGHIPKPFVLNDAVILRKTVNFGH